MKLFTRLTAAFHESRPSYSEKTSSELLDYFVSTNWAKYKQDEKLAILQEFENRLAASGGREPAIVLASSDPSLAGAYSSRGNRIWINLQNNNSYDVLDSLVHEANHAQQAYNVEYKPQRYDAHVGGMIKAENARTSDGNMYNYAQPSEENHNYDMQCNELDSNIKAVVFLLNQNEHFRDDSAYRDYLSARQKHFREINTAIVAEGNERRVMQTRQVDAATAHGDLSERQRERLENNLSNPVFIDKTVTESYRVEQWISRDLVALEQKALGEDKHTGQTEARLKTATPPNHIRSNSYGRGSMTSPEAELRSLDEGIRNWQSFWVETAQELNDEKNAVQSDPHLSEDCRVEQLHTLESRRQYLSHVYEQERAELALERQALAEQTSVQQPRAATPSEETAYVSGAANSNIQDFLPSQAGNGHECIADSEDYGIDIATDVAEHGCEMANFCGIDEISQVTTYTTEVDSSIYGVDIEQLEAPNRDYSFSGSTSHVESCSYTDSIDSERSME